MNIIEFKERIEASGITVHMSNLVDGNHVRASLVADKETCFVPTLVDLTLDESGNVIHTSITAVENVVELVPQLYWLQDLCAHSGMELKIKYFTDEIDELRYIDGKSDWIDLRAAQKVELKAGEFKLIPLGIAIQLPDGYEAHVVPRSSTFKNYGIIQTNSMGIIDETYCGDNDQWFFPAYATRDTIISVNDRICQFRIEKHQPKVWFNKVSQMRNPNRGGHGSTGRA